MSDIRLIQHSQITMTINNFSSPSLFLQQRTKGIALLIFYRYISSSRRTDKQPMQSHYFPTYLIHKPLKNDTGIRYNHQISTRGNSKRSHGRYIVNWIHLVKVPTMLTSCAIWKGKNFVASL